MKKCYRYQINKQLIMKSKLILAGFLLMSFIFSPRNGSTQHNHGAQNNGDDTDMGMLKPPHEGELVDLGKYKIELVTNLFLKDNQLTFYLFKGELKPISNEGITGVMTVSNDDGTTTTDSLLARGDDHFVGQIDVTKSSSCLVSFQIKGKMISTVFTHTGLGVNTFQYACSMHAQIKSEYRGTCSICGMEMMPLNESPDPHESLQNNHQHNH